MPAPRLLDELAPALDALPLFPLPTVLFPGALLPLHVFEPRYRAMVRDALATHGALAVVLVTDARPVDEHGHPAIARVAGAGIIVDHTEHANGRYDILVHGRARGAREELPFVPPYRRARPRVVTPTRLRGSEADVSALRVAAAAFTARVRERDPRFRLDLPEGAPPDVLADVCAHHLVLDARERQSLLEAIEPAPRVRAVTEALIVQRLTLSANKHDVN